jgi:CheY-like chemotaxis protein
VAGPEVPEILADAHQVQQVVMNLAANAAYAMREQGGTLTLRLRPAEFADPHACAQTTLPAGSYLALEVADTGAGIKPEHLAKIFDPFFTTKPTGAGSGLGLAIVQSIVSSHGGGIEVASTPGEGTVFTVYFPASAGMAAEPAAAAEGPPPSESPRGKGERVVVVEDEEGVANVLQLGLRRLGYSVRCFAAADDFYAAFKSAPFPIDLLLTDQTMPRLTGLQLARILRAEGYTFPIAMVSGYSPELTPEALRGIGPATLLAKPFDLTRLAVVLRTLLPARR